MWAALALSVGMYGAPARAQQAHGAPDPAVASPFRFDDIDRPEQAAGQRPDTPHRHTLTDPAEIARALRLLWSSHAALCRFEGCRVAVGGLGAQPTGVAVIGSARATSGQLVFADRLKDGRVIVGWHADPLQARWRHAGSLGPGTLVLQWQRSAPGPERIVASFAIRALVVEAPRRRTRD